MYLDQRWFQDTLLVILLTVFDVSSSHIAILVSCLNYMYLAAVILSQLSTGFQALAWTELDPS